MDVRKLRYVVALARHLSYSRAAEDLGISQPTLTRAVQSLELELGLRLFDRDRARVALTPQGRSIVERSAAIVAEIADLERHADLAAQGRAGKVRFGMGPLPAHVLLADGLLSLFDDAPLLSVEVITRNPDALLRSLLKEEIEFFIGADAVVALDTPVRREELGTFPINLVVRAGHPLLSGPQGDTRYPLLMGILSGNHAPLDRQRVFPDDLEAIVSETTYLVEGFDVLMSITRRSDAIWLTSGFCAFDELQSGELRTLPFGPGPGRDYRLILYSLARRTPSPAAQMIKQIFRKRIRDLRSRWDQALGQLGTNSSGD